MTNTYSCELTKKLTLTFILENIEYRKKCLFLQEIISMSKENEIWRHALAAFFDTPASSFSQAFSKN
ncbi:MAG: hypothetical protein WDO71_19045 [Bacteroidota bacterium]